MNKMKAPLLIAVLTGFLPACTGSHMQMTPTHVEETAAGKPITDTLIIVVIDDEELRVVFEKHFKDWLAAKGVEAVTSSEIFPNQQGIKLEKQVIDDVIDKYENDSALITHLVRFDETEVFTRDQPRFVGSYYSYYGYAWGYVYHPTVYGENVKFTLETRLYDVKNEKLLWSGESQITNPKTAGQAIGQVVAAVMEELEKNGLLPKLSSEKPNR